MKKLLLIIFGLLVTIQARAVTLARVKNDTVNTLYKVMVPLDNYEVLLPPGTEADFGSWLDLRRYKEVQCAVLKGDGEPIFVHIGPESAGCASEESFAQSIVYWQGLPNPSEEDKIYKTCCMPDEKMHLELHIHADGHPEITENGA